MVILQLISTNNWTGPADYVIKLSKFLQENNCKVLIGYRASIPGSLELELKNQNIYYTNLLQFSRKFKPIQIYKDIFNLKKILMLFKPDIVHTHFSLENVYTFILKNFLQRNNIKVLRSIHNERAAKKRVFSKILLNSNDYLHTICSEYKRFLIEENSIFEKKIDIINGFVDSEKFKVNQKKDFFWKNYNISNDYIKIGMVARFQPHRGHDKLIFAFNELLKQRKIKNCKLILVGKGENIENIKKIVKELEIENNVLFTGYVKKELPELLNSLDIFVLLEEGSDGSCRAILEAMSCGLPIVSVNKGAIMDTVQNNINGFLIRDKSNIDELANKLELLIRDSELRKKFGSNSRAIVLENFNMKKQLNKYLKLYNKILKNDK